jgi:excisionase family DNA binding protein
MVAVALPDYLTVGETVSALNYSAEYVRRMIRKGKLHADMKCGVWLVHREAVEAYREAIRGKTRTTRHEVTSYEKPDMFLLAPYW